MFLSYSRREDAGPAIAIGDALRASGLRVFWDDAEVPAFQAISPTIMGELAHAKVLLTYYSLAYPTRRACQHELTTAFVAGQQESAPTRRVLVVNPEPGFGHIQPIQLRDARHVRAPRSRRDLAELAELVATHVATIDTPIGAVQPHVLPLWLPAPARARPRPFAGRMPELWQLHSALHPDVAPLTSPDLPAVAVVQGEAGTGKTALVTEYAYRFASAFPGGIFWLTSEADLVAIAGVLAGQDIKPARAIDVLAAHLHRHGLAALWVLDGFPPGDPRLAIAPHPLARTVLTTRDPALREFGTPIDLPPLDQADLAALRLTPATQNLLHTLATNPPIQVTDDNRAAAQHLTSSGLAHVDGDLLTPSPLIRTAHGGEARPAPDSATERSLAWRLQVELAHRLTAISSGQLRAALTSLHSLFGFSRTLLREARPASRASAGLAATVVPLLENHVRPLLTRWHPELMAHEQQRTQPNPIAHELDWPRHGELHTALGELADTLRATIADLSVITGTAYGLT